MAAKFEPGNQAAAGPHDMSDSETQKALLAMYVTLALSDKSKPMEKIAAGEAWQDRKFGKSVALVKNEISSAPAVQIYIPDNNRDPQTIDGSAESK